MPTGNVSSTSTLHIFRETHYLRGLLCLPGVYLVSHFPSLRRVQGSTPTGVFEGGCRPLTHSSLGFPFHFALFVTSSLNLCGWWHVWSKCQLLRQSSVADCIYLDCQAGGWNRICCAILQGGSPKCIVQPSQDPGSSDLKASFNPGDISWEGWFVKWSTSHHPGQDSTPGQGRVMDPFGPSESTRVRTPQCSSHLHLHSIH